MFPQNIFQVLFLTFLVTVSFTSAQNDPRQAHGDNHHEVCQQDKDCGEGASCNPSTHQCQCPGQQGKDYIIIPEAKPICQKPAAVKESCEYDAQCTHISGNLTRCDPAMHKCMCFDTKTNGREVMRYYKGSCYFTTTVNHTCTTDNQCQASIKPVEHVKCEQDYSSPGRKAICKCEDGHKCEEKEPEHNGAGVVEAASILRFTLVGIMATKVFL